MKYTYRKVKNSSQNIGVQIGYYEKGNFKVKKHLGTTHNDVQLDNLVKEASRQVNKLNSSTKQLTLFKEKKIDLEKEFLKNYQPLEIKYSFAHQQLKKYFDLIGYENLESDLLKDLALIRIIKATSKRESLKLLSQYFDINYSESLLYKAFKGFQKYKRQVEDINTQFATEKLNQDLTVMFYDVTTLYFESFKPKELQTLGFSKDNKFCQPQLVIGLVITDKGFPLTYHTYQGKKFEGHTMIPTIEQYLRKNKQNLITVVADAGMLSRINIVQLKQLGWKYIVGARLSNLSKKCFDQIKKHNFSENGDLDINTKLGRLIISFSQKRFRKDNLDLEKSIEKAKSLVKNPSKMTSRYKYVKKDKKLEYSLNNSLIDKRKVLLGLKGYYTNTNYSIDRIISEYKNLWKIEQNFRVLKSDLACRPIYHWKPANIQGHLLVSFIALGVSKYIEISKQQSIKSYIKEIIQIKTLKLLHLKSEQILSFQI